MRFVTMLLAGLLPILALGQRADARRACLGQIDQREIDPDDPERQPDGKPPARAQHQDIEGDDGHGANDRHRGQQPPIPQAGPKLSILATPLAGIIIFIIGVAGWIALGAATRMLLQKRADANPS